jgi:hypothetical protein
MEQSTILCSMAFCQAFFLYFFAVLFYLGLIAMAGDFIASSSFFRIIPGPQSSHHVNFGSGLVRLNGVIIRQQIGVTVQPGSDVIPQELVDRRKGGNTQQGPKNAVNTAAQCDRY